MKCKCEFCDQNIDFDISLVSRITSCPGCGRWTTLTDGTEKTWVTLPSKITGFRWAFNWVAGIALGLGALAVVIYSLSNPTTAAAISPALIILGGIIAVMWVAFPVIVCVQLSKLIKLQRATVERLLEK